MTTNVSRMILPHPDLGAAGGSTLWDAITAIYKKVGDNTATRMLVAVNLTNGLTVQLNHDFRTAFANLRYQLFVATSTDPYDLARVTAGSSPALSAFTIAAGAVPTTQIALTNNTGVTRTLVLAVYCDAPYLAEGAIKDVIITSATNGQVIRYDGTNWVNVDLPGSQGELNLILNSDADTPLNASRTNAVGDWIDAGTGTTPTKTTTTSEIALYPTKTTGIKITNDGSGTSYTQVRFTLPPALAQRKLKISWEQIVSTSTAYVAGDFKLELYTNSATNYSGSYVAVPLASDVSGVTAIPAQAGRLQTSFDAGALTAYELRITRVAGASGSYISLNAVTVGPGIQAQGAVVTPTTVTTVPFVQTSMVKGTTLTDKFSWQRVGDWLEFQIEYSQTGAGTNGSGTIGISLPTGLTIDGTRINGPSAGVSVVGRGYMYAGAGNTEFQAEFAAAAGGTALGLYYRVDQDSLLSAGATQLPFNNAATTLTGSGRVPIAQWAGGGTVNVDRNDVEWASNSNATNTATDTTSFVNGPAGALMPNGATGTSYVRRIRFSRPAPEGVMPRLLFKDVGQSTWIPMESGFPYVTQGTSKYGVSISSVSGSTTDFDVTFWGSGVSPSNATYAGVGTAFSSFSTVRWTAVLGQPGQAIGFGEATETSLGLVKPSHTTGSTQLTYSATSGRERSGTYLPTFVSTANLDTTPGTTPPNPEWMWSQNGRVVTVSGYVTINATTISTATTFTATVPVLPTSNFASAQSSAIGLCVMEAGGSGTAAVVGTVFATVGAKTITVAFSAVDVASGRTLHVQYQYLLN